MPNLRRNFQSIAKRVNMEKIINEQFKYLGLLQVFATVKSYIVRLREKRFIQHCGSKLLSTKVTLTRDVRVNRRNDNLAQVSISSPSKSSSDTDDSRSDGSEGVRDICEQRQPHQIDIDRYQEGKRLSR